MRGRLFRATMVGATMMLGLLTGVGAAVAQSQTKDAAPPALSEAQRAAIATAVRDTKIPPPFNRFSMAIGAQVPPSIELYALPISALSQAPEARDLRYTMVQDQVVLVDPMNMRVVDVIRTSRP